MKASEATCRPVFHPKDDIDIAAFRVEDIHPGIPVVKLGSHLDDWIVRSEWRLSEAIILGYPPIPYTLEPTLVAARAEINTIIWPRTNKKAHFILSATPRGGFSGGLAIHRSNFALGLITESLARDNLPAELGFLAVLSVEPIYECLAENKLLPECQKEGWDDFWNTKSADFCDRNGLMVVSVGVHDDGKRPYCEIFARDAGLMGIALKAIVAASETIWTTKEVRRDDWVRVHFGDGAGGAVGLSERVLSAAREAERAIVNTGLRQVTRLDR